MYSIKSEACFVLILFVFADISQSLNSEFPFNRFPKTQNSFLGNEAQFHGDWGSVSDGRPMHHIMTYAGLPRYMKVYPLALMEADHELTFNVSWVPSIDRPATDYSIEVQSTTQTDDCDSPMCYEYNIPGHTSWWLIPSRPSFLAHSCSIQPGCSYSVILTAHPWDGHSTTNLQVNLNECVAGICSCAHASKLPTPKVTAKMVSIQGELFANVSWTLSLPKNPQRLPTDLNKQYYYVSLGKQLVSNAHPAPWFKHDISRKVDADGSMLIGDHMRWILLPIADRSNDQRGRKPSLVLDVRLLARVSVIDDRGCMGPAGNATAYEPSESGRSYKIYVLWALFGGACVLSTFAILAASTRCAKCAMIKIRATQSTAPTDSLCRQQAWFSAQLTR